MFIGPGLWCPGILLRVRSWRKRLSFGGLVVHDVLDPIRVLLICHGEEYSP